MKRFTFCWTATLVMAMGLAACDSEVIVGPTPPSPTDLAAASEQQLTTHTPEARLTISSDPVRGRTPEETEPRHRFPSPVRVQVPRDSYCASHP